MAPNPNKPYRVCDSCCDKLKKAIETCTSSHLSLGRRGSMNQGINGYLEKDEKLDTLPRPHLTRLSSIETLKQGDSHTKRNKRLEFNSSRVSPIPNGSSQWGAVNLSNSFNPVFGSSKKFFSASVPGSRIVSRATSLISRHASPPRSTTPTPTLGGLTSPKIAFDDGKMANESLSQEVSKLKAQVENLNLNAQRQEIELERTAKQLKEAIANAEEEAAKCKAAKEVIKSLIAQLKEMAERLPVGSVRNVKSAPFTSIEPTLLPDEISISSISRLNGKMNVQELEQNNLSVPVNTSSRTLVSNRQGHNDTIVGNVNRTKENDSRTEGEWVEQDEPGVYITLTSLPGGLKDLKRVRFSRKRFSEKQAEEWWSENRGRVYDRYNVRMIEKSSVGVGSEDLAF